MNIYGDRIVLRAIDVSDAELLLKLINDPETERMLGGFSFPVSMEGQIKWIGSQTGRNDILRCIVAPKEDEACGLGTVILSDIDYVNGVAQVHIKMDKEKGRGQGYGTDAINAIVDYAFRELRLHCVYADVLDYNIPSHKLFKKCGFRKDGVLRSRVFKGGRFVDVISFSRLCED